MRGTALDILRTLFQGGWMFPDMTPEWAIFVTIKMDGARLETLDLADTTGAGNWTVRAR